MAARSAALCALRRSAAIVPMTMPNTTVRKIGNTIANSTAVAPRRHEENLKALARILDMPPRLPSLGENYLYNFCYLREQSIISNAGIAMDSWIGFDGRIRKSN